LNKALAILYPEATVRREVYRELRTKLRDSCWEEVANRLQADYANRYPQEPSQPGTSLTVDQKECLRVINYIRHHGKEGHMDYGKYRLMGLPPWKRGDRKRDPSSGEPEDEEQWNILADQPGRRNADASRDRTE